MPAVKASKLNMNTNFAGSKVFDIHEVRTFPDLNVSIWRQCSSLHSRRIASLFFEIPNEAHVLGLSWWAWVVFTIWTCFPPFFCWWSRGKDAVLNHASFHAFNLYVIDNKLDSWPDNSNQWQQNKNTIKIYMSLAESITFSHCINEKTDSLSHVKF